MSKIESIKDELKLMALRLEQDEYESKLLSGRISRLESRASAIRDQIDRLNGEAAEDIAKLLQDHHWLKVIFSDDSKYFLGHPNESDESRLKEDLEIHFQNFRIPALRSILEDEVLVDMREARKELEAIMSLLSVEHLDEIAKVLEPIVDSITFVDSTGESSGLYLEFRTLDMPQGLGSLTIGLPLSGCDGPPDVSFIPDDTRRIVDECPHPAVRFQCLYNTTHLFKSDLRRALERRDIVRAIQMCISCLNLDQRFALIPHHTSAAWNLNMRFGVLTKW